MCTRIESDNMADTNEMEVEDEFEGSDDNDSGDDNEESEQGGVFIPGKTKLEDGGELESDPSAYVFLHQLQAGAPCLSFDIIPDRLGDKREDFPLACYIAAGTQSSKGEANYINVMKLHNLTKTQQEDDDDSDDEDELSDEEDDPVLNLVTLHHTGSVNRLRVANIDGQVFTGSWSETGSVYIHDISKPLGIVDDKEVAKAYNPKQTNLVHTISKHSTEGFAIDWSSVTKGLLATGDCAKGIFVSQLTDTGCTTGESAYIGHTDSVEDIQWSVTESSVFASCSVDRSIRIWNAQQNPSKANVLTLPEAHTRDINVIHWNHVEKHLLASGGDDGIIKIWDLRMLKRQPVEPVAVFKQHSQPITSLEWNPHDPGVLAVSGADDQITIWDFSVERDEGAGEEDVDVPPQLLFQHCGQTDMKELHWHPQLPGVIISTAQSDFNVFRTICV